MPGRNDKFSWHPSRCFVIPDSVAVIPDSVAVIPDSVAVIPDSVAVIPDSMAVIPDSIRDPGPRRHWIADQVRNDKPGLAMTSWVRNDKLGSQ
jgi:hypothetical protein